MNRPISPERQRRDRLDGPQSQSTYHDPRNEVCAPSCGAEHGYLLPAIAAELDTLSVSPKRVFDIGCGNGAVANWFAGRGFEVHGVDPSESGIAAARRAFSDLDLRPGSAYDDLAAEFGQFPLVVSLEVVEHVYAPRKFAASVSNLLLPGGHALISTPYHGYLKNLALALTGKMDSHFTALWDHGHIKFWSRDTISTLLKEAGLEILRIHRVGRIPPLAKTMLVVAQKPLSS
jgi:2-polyprenyl-6-hydroxyphenyl methylase/3-demethylubiquinone-9 3-methyltransferase